MQGEAWSRADAAEVFIRNGRGQRQAWRCGGHGGARSIGGQWLHRRRAEQQQHAGYGQFDLKWTGGGRAGVNVPKRCRGDNGTYRFACRDSQRLLTGGIDLPFQMRLALCANAEGR